jgi:ligand-binding sensor domain-containing protein
MKNTSSISWLPEYTFFMNTQSINKWRWSMNTLHRLAAIAYACLAFCVLASCTSTPSTEAAPKGPQIPAAGVTSVLSGQFLAMEKDQSGILWVASPNGVKRFDGNEWKDFGAAEGLKTTKITCMSVDRNGQVWVGTGSTWDFSGDGVFRFDGKSWTQFTTKDGLSSNAVLSLKGDSKGNIWAGALDSICMFDGTRWTALVKETGRYIPRTFAEAANGAMYIGDFEGVYKFADGKITKIFDMPTFSLAFDRQGNLYCGHYQDQVSKYDGSQFVTQKLETVDRTLFLALKGVIASSPQTNADTVFVDSHDTVWLSSHFYSGIFMLNDGKWNPITPEKDGIVDSRASGGNAWSLLRNVIMEDSKGNIWLGTSSGLSRYKGGAWLSFYGSNANFIVEDGKGFIWVGGNGLYKISPDS